MAHRWLEAEDCVTREEERLGKYKRKANYWEVPTRQGSGGLVLARVPWAGQSCSRIIFSASEQTSTISTVLDPFCCLTVKIPPIREMAESMTLCLERTMQF